MLLLPVFAFSQTYLYPPLDLQGEPIECNIYLTWAKPELPGGGTPLGLLGYNLYNIDSLIGYISGQDTTWYYDMVTQSEHCPFYPHTYWVTAVYDLAYYGNPGQIGESGSTDTIVVTVTCDFPFPLYEFWDYGSFSYNFWTFEPSQGNWDIDVTLGTPPPVAVFSGSPVTENYSFLLRSIFQPSEILSNCLDFFLDFDLLLENVSNTGSETFTVMGMTCESSTWDTLFIISNASGFGWTHYQVDCNQYRGNSFTVGFMASGQNSSNIQHWLLDNILLSFRCRPPVNPELDQSGNVVNLSWNPPLCDNGTNPDIFVTGYNVYRSDENGAPPFIKLNTSVITDTLYSDVLPIGIFPATYKYYITDYQNDTSQNVFLCESRGTDTLVALYTGIGSFVQTGCKITPNPNDGRFTATCPDPVLSLEVRDIRGNLVYVDNLAGQSSRQIRIDLSDHPKGIYILTIRSESGTFRSKIVVC